MFKLNGCYQKVPKLVLLRENSADIKKNNNKIKKNYLIFPENKHFMHIIVLRDNLNEMSNSLENARK